MLFIVFIYFIYIFHCIYLISFMLFSLFYLFIIIIFNEIVFLLAYPGLPSKEVGKFGLPRSMK